MAAPIKSSGTTTAGNAGVVVDAATEAGGTVVLRGVTVGLDTDVGQAFIADCARHLENLSSDAEIKDKWGLSDEDWARLATNTPLLSAIRLERERRIFSGECAREAAQRHFAKAPNVLNRNLTDEQIAPRHRIEAARELRQAAGNDPDIAPGPKEKFIITIDLGGDEKLVFEKEIDPRGPSLPDDEELP
jgi:hypothetical protein